MQMSVLKDLSDVLTKSFYGFASNGLLKKEFLQKYDNMIKSMMTIMIHGLPDFYQISKIEQERFILNSVWSMIVPCLTKQGYAEYQLLLPKNSKRNL